MFQICRQKVNTTTLKPYALPFSRRVPKTWEAVPLPNRLALLTPPKHHIPGCYAFVLLGGASHTCRHHQSSHHAHGEVARDPLLRSNARVQRQSTPPKQAPRG